MKGQKAIVGAVQIEMNGLYRELFDALQSASRCGLCDSEVDPEELQEFVRAENIGQGEAHSILACRNQDICFVCDDRRARQVAERVIGKDKVIGSIGILCSLLATGVLNIEETLRCLDEMMKSGGFLPTMDEDYWRRCEAGEARLKQ
ncbi:hypothetical protein A9K72_33070 [Mesorhizobium loti]|uniref:DUF3368 domain-containing protein n=1 Tax=Mesorhizobium jarvisii TaxID=1777867 RepID=A0AA92X9G8_9HYPH|nr:hypothetical protein A9K72_33070 [Mesorhizobium loti]RJT28551.1 hypothetical protein D3242_31830 [Mesorhizobium jarvisii]